MSAAVGPTLLDMGDILYAPNTLEDTDKVGLRCTAEAMPLHASLECTVLCV